MTLHVYARYLICVNSAVLVMFFLFVRTQCGILGMLEGITPPIFENFSKLQMCICENFRTFVRVNAPPRYSPRDWYIWEMCNGSVSRCVTKIT